MPADLPEAPTIFVALAAYREPEVADTVRSCLDRADHPERLTFGICHQYDDTVPGATFDALDELAERTTMRLLRYPHPASKGGCWARHIVQGLYDGEDLTLQADAHCRMAPGWDTTLIQAMGAIPSAKPLFTGALPLYRVVDGRDELLDPIDDPMPVTVVRTWCHEGWIDHTTVPAPAGVGNGLRPTRFLQGGFVFTLGRWNVEVRQDPEHLYTGEELALTLRSYTWGYDLWNPPRRVIWHRLHDELAPKYIQDDPDGRQAWRHGRAVERLRVLWDGDPDGILGPYSLGRERTLEQYMDFAGLEWPSRTVHPDAITGIPPDPVTLGI